MVNDAIHSSAAAVSDDSHSISRIAANRLRLVPLSWKGETVELTLQSAPVHLCADTLVRTLPTVFADRPYRIECEGAMLKRLAAVTIELNDDVVLCSSTSRDGLQFFAQPTDPNLFADVFGLARLSVSLRRPDALVPELFYAPPIHVLLPKGERAEAISKMAVRVASASDRLFPKEHSHDRMKEDCGESSSEKAIRNQEEALERIIQLYERHFSYFRTNARSRLSEREEVGAFAKLKSFTQKTLEFIVRHPEELEPAPGGIGIRPNGIGPAWLPRRSLIRSAQPSFNTYENQALVGFLTSLAHEIDTESAELTAAAEQLPHTQFNVPEGYVPSTAAIFAESAKRLQLAASRFLQF